MNKQLNRRVTVIVPGINPGNRGWNKTSTIIDSWEKWAHVENRSGGNQSYAQQQVWTYDHKIWLRRERTRPTKSNFIIEYEGAHLEIKSLVIDGEGYKDYEILYCSKVDKDVLTETGS